MLASMSPRAKRPARADPFPEIEEPTTSEQAMLLVEELRQFDMNPRYGPCLTLGRRDRWKRAAQFGLQPPERVMSILGLECMAEQQDNLWAVHSL